MFAVSRDSCNGYMSMTDGYHNVPSNPNTSVSLLPSYHPVSEKRIAFPLKYNTGTENLSVPVSIILKLFLLIDT